MSTASKVYPNHNPTTDVLGRRGLQTLPNGAVVNKVPRGSSAVPVKTAKNAPGNQGTKNSHTKPSAIKPNGTPAQMRPLQSTTSTAPLQKVGGNQLGDKKGASNAHALRLKAMYPSSHSDTSRKL